MERLDRILSQAGVCSRKDCARLARRGLITVDGKTIKDPSEKIDEDASIEVEGNPVERRRTVVCIMNKKAGYVTSTDDDLNATVMELLPENLLRQGIVPAGRLDKDTEGLLVFTNDGDLLHRLISPKSEVAKEYYIEYEGSFQDDAPEIAKRGVALKDGTICKSAELKLLGEGRCTITITEGMYHQIKRMVAALGAHVRYLKRIRIGKLELGILEPGRVRELTAEDVELLFK